MYAAMSKPPASAVPAELQQLVADVDTGARTPRGWAGRFLTAVAITWSLAQLWYASPLPYVFGWGVINDTEARALHLGVGIFLAFLAYPLARFAPRERIPAYDWLLAIAGAFAGSYLFFFYAQIAARPSQPTPMDTWVSVAGVLLLFEATRRALGWPMAALAALFMMAVILLWQFNNFWQVALTLSAVILSTAGVLVGVNLLLPYVSILMIGTGIVALAGIVVNNNIILIDTFNRLREDGRSPEDAAIATAAQRIRPILLTTGTTMFGLFPMIIQMNVSFADGAINFGGASSEWWVQLATAVVFGLGFSTMMILLVTPAWLLAPYRIGRWSKRQWNRVYGLVRGTGAADADPSYAANDPGEKKSVLPAAE